MAKHTKQTTPYVGILLSICRNFTMAKHTKQPTPYVGMLLSICRNFTMTKHTKQTNKQKQKRQ